MLKSDESLIHDINDLNYNFIILELTLLAFGMILNIIFLIIIYRNIMTKSFNSRKPMGFLLIVLTIGDLWYFMSNIYTNINNIFNLPDINILCQLSSYFSNYFTALSECSMLAGNYILIWILFSASHISKNHLKLSKINKQSSRKETKTNKLKSGCKNRLFQKCNHSSNNSTARSKPKRPNFKEKFLKNSLFLVDTFRLRKIDFYAKITNREGFLVILFVFVCLYSLSFIIWTHGVHEREHTPNLTPNGTSSDLAEDYNLSKLCNTFDFAKQFMSNYFLFIASFRLICLISNLVTSFIYHIKFRSHVCESMSNKFKKNEKETTKLKSYNYKTFHLFYAAVCTKLKDKETVELNNEETRSKDNYKLHSIHLLFVQLYAIFALLYSFLIFPVVMKELIDAVYQFKKYNLAESTSPQLNIPFLNFSIESIGEPSLDLFNLDEKNLTEDKNMTQAFMNSFFSTAPETPKEAFNLDFFINFCQKLAHMIKLPILIVFLVHVNFFFRFEY